MKYQISDQFLSEKATLLSMVKDFKSSGKDFIIGKRNAIKLFDIHDTTVNIKSFRIPNLVNKIAYKYFRKSKARRSFEYANKLLENNIGTPQPIGFQENYDFIGLNDSYYISEHLNPDLTFRELVTQPDYPDHETILRQFTKFSFDLHEKGIEFLDHSPGNTLIKKNALGHYDFYLVDLNRMNFHSQMNFDSRMKNLRRLTFKEDMIAVMSNEYAKHYNQPEALIFEKLWYETSEFQKGFARKKRLKKKLKFWK